MDKKLTVRVTPEQLQKIRKNAEKVNMNISDFVRSVAVDNAPLYMVDKADREYFDKIEYVARDLMYFWKIFNTKYKNISIEDRPNVIIKGATFDEWAVNIKRSFAAIQLFVFLHPEAECLGKYIKKLELPNN